MASTEIGITGDLSAVLATACLAGYGIQEFIKLDERVIARLVQAAGITTPEHAERVMAELHRVVKRHIEIYRRGVN
jgi:hypothetical protein